MKRKPIPKDVRLRVYNKYNGHCAYCGCELEYKDMQVDHLMSVASTEWKNRDKVDQLDTIGNYMPSCRMCNYYKGALDIEDLRRILQTTLMRNVRRPFDYRLAVKYGLVKEDVHPIKFYFERDIDNLNQGSI